MDKNLTIVTYNIRNSVKAESLCANILSLTKQGANVFCLQELRRNKNKEFIVDSLLRQLGATWRAEYMLGREYFDLGLCILWETSVLEALSFEELLLPKPAKVQLKEKVFLKVMSRIEKADGKYTQPPQRAALIGHFNFNGKTLRISNLHLDWQGGFKQRGAQLKHLRDYLKAKKAAEFEIFCGDFNTVGFYRFSDKRLSKLKKVLGEEYINAFHNQRTTSYLQMLDHIFVKNMVVSKAQVLKLKGSDHFPLMAEIKI